jgi:predicted RND superfamily exporter protein
VLVAGFGTLAFGTFIPNVYFGMLTAIILGVGYLTDMVLLPAILLIRADRKAARAAAPVQATSAVNA